MARKKKLTSSSLLSSLNNLDPQWKRSPRAHTRKRVKKQRWSSNDAVDTLLEGILEDTRSEAEAEKRQLANLLQQRAETAQRIREQARQQQIQAARAERDAFRAQLRRDLQPLPVGIPRVAPRADTPDPLVLQTREATRKAALELASVHTPSPAAAQPLPTQPRGRTPYIALAAAAMALVLTLTLAFSGLFSAPSAQTDFANAYPQARVSVATLHSPSATLGFETAPIAHAKAPTTATKTRPASTSRPPKETHNSFADELEDFDNKVFDANATSWDR